MMPHRLFTLHARAASAGLKDESDARSACRPARWHSRLLYAAFLLFGIAGPTQAQTAGPQAAYSLDEGSGTVVTDVSGHGNTLDLVNAPVWSTGHYGGALSFNGTNNRAVARAYNAALGLTGRSFTLSAWVYPRTNSGWQMIVNKPARSGHSAPYFDWSLHRETSTGRIVGYLGCDGQQRTSNATTPLNAWTYVTVTYDGTSLRHYLNGVLDRTTAVTCAVANTSSQPIR
ncbi:MAG TPA: LamG domain-containing protein, partial [Steroidobacteraceae bacterium]|nr:LamG domain-containing protein [Steroidobacteraceae bacterium]